MGICHCLLNHQYLIIFIFPQHPQHLVLPQSFIYPHSFMHIIVYNPTDSVVDLITSPLHSTQFSEQAALNDRLTHFLFCIDCLFYDSYSLPHSLCICLYIVFILLKYLTVNPLLFTPHSVFPGALATSADLPRPLSDLRPVSIVSKASVPRH